MGQVALGFRSLFIKLTIFVIMAALLAWALGGTLWPRAEIADQTPITLNGDAYFWRLEAGGGTIRSRRDGEARWRLMTHGESGAPMPVPDFDEVAEVSRLVVANDALHFAVRPDDADPTWRLVRYDGTAFTLDEEIRPDRLAVEVQLARIAAGYPTEDAATADTRRPDRIGPAN